MDMFKPKASTRQPAIGELRAIPGHPVPPGAICARLGTEDGVVIRSARWPQSPHMPCRGTVAVLPGRAEFIEKYYEVITELTMRGFCVAMLDWRGQGGSERLLANPHAGYVDDFTHYQRDFSAFLSQVLRPHCPYPHYALSHSMGGAILMEALQTHYRDAERVVMVAPMLGLALGRYEGVARFTARVGHLLGLGSALIPGGDDTPVNLRPFEPNRVTSDPRRFAVARDIIKANPELGIGAPTLGWLDAAFACMERITAPQALRDLRQPLLMVAGSGDRVVSNRVIEHVSARLIAGGHLTIPTAKHEVMMEQDPLRAQFWAIFDAFIPPSALPASSVTPGEGHDPIAAQRMAL